jgi:hypothetical protein
MLVPTRLGNAKRQPAQLNVKEQGNGHNDVVLNKAISGFEPPIIILTDRAM